MCHISITFGAEPAFALCFFPLLPEAGRQGKDAGCP